MCGNQREPERRSSPPPKSLPLFDKREVSSSVVFGGVMLNAESFFSWRFFSANRRFFVIMVFPTRDTPSVPSSLDFWSIPSPTPDLPLFFQLDCLPPLIFPPCGIGGTRLSPPPHQMFPKKEPSPPPPECLVPPRWIPFLASKGPPDRRLPPPQPPEPVSQTWFKDMSLWRLWGLTLGFLSFSVQSSRGPFFTSVLGTVFLPGSFTLFSLSRDS